MKKSWLCMVACALLFSVSATQAALVHTDYYNAKSIKLSASGTDSDAWTFDILADGYDPVVENVISATIELNLTDDSGGHHKMRRLMDGTEYAQLEAGGDVLANWEVDTGTITFAVLSLMSLSTTGALDVTLTATSGDFYFDDATLTAEAAVVPVPAAVWLFGSGLLSLVGVVKHKRG